MSTYRRRFASRSASFSFGEWFLGYGSHLRPDARASSPGSGQNAFDRALAGYLRADDVASARRRRELGRVRSVEHMTCGKAYRWMQSAIDGELLPHRHASLEMHCRRCPACRAKYLQLTAIHGAFTNLAEQTGFASSSSTRIEFASPNVFCWQRASFLPSCRGPSQRCFASTRPLSEFAAAWPSDHVHVPLNAAPLGA